MRVYCLGSGSTGNFILVEAEGARIAVDAGMSPTSAVVRARALGIDLFDRAYGAPRGIIVTHEHGDHFAQAGPLARALRAPLYLHAKTPAEGLRRKLGQQVREYVPGEALALGPFIVEALVVPHDAVQVALRIRAGRHAVGVATDLGHVPSGLAAFLGACDLAFVEANYCPRLLALGPYPPHLKRRVDGPLGHLANDETALLAEALARTGLRCLVLCHLSRVNNTPERALAVVGERSGGLALDVLPHGAPRLFDLDALPARPPPRPGRFTQLELPLTLAPGRSL